MRSPLRQLFSTIALMAALAGTCNAQTALPGTDTRSYLTADISAKLSLAGTWMPIDAAGDKTGLLVGPYWNVIKLGASQQEGVALGGWVFNGSFASALPDVTPVGAALLEQQSDGTLIDATTLRLGNPVTNGAGSVIVADFNGDGLDDLVYPAHNESPYLYKHSTAYISKAGGGFDKLTLADNVMNHDARLVTLDGKKKILARSFGGSGNNGNGAGFNVIYSWSGSTLTADTSLGDLGGMSVLAGPFTGNSDNWLIIGDSAGGGPGVQYSPTNPMLNYAYKYNAGVLTTPPEVLPKPYFNDKPAYAGFSSFWDPYSKTHTSRLWTTDLNQDGLPDILAGQELWAAGPAGLQKNVFQLLINRGNMVFTDDTDALAPEFSQDSYTDYSVRFADVDGSGIDTMFHSSNPGFSNSADAAKQGQYILVNDGTGRLYAAMHDEFRAMRTQIAAFLNPLIPGGGASNAITPQFIAYRNASGLINFVAVVSYFMPNAEPHHRFAFVNVPLGINLATDFRRDLTVATRNGSKRIRTFAGNDTIRRALSDPDCTIDGGLGANTAVYPGNKAAWLVTKTSDKITVRPASGPGGTDTLTRIQRAQFDDQTVDLNALPVTTATTKQNYSDSWWNAAESGWGLTITDHGTNAFVQWYTYDQSGHNQKYVIPGGIFSADKCQFSGAIQHVTGPGWSLPAFDQNQVTRRTAGSAGIDFCPSGLAAGTIIFNYTADGVSGSKQLTRLPFGNDVPRWGGTANTGVTDYTDLWWNPSESGWGVSVTQHGNNLFFRIFVYDTDGRPLLFVVPGVTFNTPSSFTGALQLTTGPSFASNPFNPNQVVRTPAGTATLTFTDANNGVLSYTVNGVTKTSLITRLVF